MTVTAILGGPDEACKTQIDCAIELTRRLKTTLKGLTIMPDPVNSVMYFASAEAVMAGAPGVDAVKQAQDKTNATLDALFDSKTRQEKWLRAHFESLTGSIPAYAAAEAALSDAFVFPRGSASSNHALNPAFEHTLMTARLPLILASGDGRADGPPVIAWDGSPQAARAIRFHLTLLMSYDEVIIAQQSDKLRPDIAQCASTTPEALAAWLGEERLGAKIETFDGAVGEGLIKLVKKYDSSLIVMGAYGHSRMGEMLFGGTSRALLNANEGPALALAH
ncbi:MAG: universal stress protein [Pseudomonadota bacterium]